MLRSDKKKNHIHTLVNRENTDNSIQYWSLSIMEEEGEEEDDDLHKNTITNLKYELYTFDIFFR